MKAYAFQSQPHVDLVVRVFTQANGKPADVVKLVVLEEADWKVCQAVFEPWLRSSEQRLPATLPPPSAGRSRWDELRRDVETGKLTLALFAPRGVGDTAWTADEKRWNLIRRRFMLLGQTLDGMRVWDIRRAMQAMDVMPETQGKRRVVAASGVMGVNALYAAMFEPGDYRLELKQLPGSHRESPDYLNVLQVLDIPRALQLVRERMEIDLQ